MAHSFIFLSNDNIFTSYFALLNYICMHCLDIVPWSKMEPVSNQKGQKQNTMPDI